MINVNLFFPTFFVFSTFFHSHLIPWYSFCKLSLLAKIILTLADRKTQIWKLISIYFYIDLISPVENSQTFNIEKWKHYNNKKRQHIGKVNTTWAIFLIVVRILVNLKEWNVYWIQREEGCIFKFNFWYGWLHSFVNFVKTGLIWDLVLNLKNQNSPSSFPVSSTFTYVEYTLQNKVLKFNGRA